MDGLMRDLVGTLVLLSGALTWGATAAALDPPPPIPGVDWSTAAFVGTASSGPLDTPITVEDYAGFVALFGAETAGSSLPYLAPSVAAYFANGGRRLVVVRVADATEASLMGADGGPGARTGLQALLDVDEVSVVAIPGATSLAVQNAMIAHCEQAGDRFAVLDPPSNADVTAVLAHRQALSTVKGHAALYFPWLSASPTGTSLVLPPSGFVAGIVSRTRPPTSPVDLVATATGVTFTVTTAQQDLLNPQGINAIRFFTGQGVRVWGARTLATDPEWIFLSVRRMRSYLEESIEEGTRWALSEPNDQTLWTALRGAVEDFLYARFVEGWFPGISPQEAYFVRCDVTTMTQADVEAGRTVILVGYAPARPSEFMIFRVVHDRSSLTAIAPPIDRMALLHPPRPNPFNPRTEIRFTLGSPSLADLLVYDATGRLVDRLCAGEVLGAGEHARTWSATDLLGRRVASGVYRILLRTEDGERTMPVVLVR